MDIRVECHAGYRGEESPRRLHFGDRTVDVTEVVDAWHGPDHRYFRVAGSDGAVYLIRHDESRRTWALVQYRRSGTDAAAGPVTG